MPAQFALLGSTGTVGSAILQTLLRPASSAHVTLLVRSPGKLPAEVKGDGRVTVLTGDMDDAAAVKSVVKGGKDGVIAALNEQDVGRRLKQFGHLVAAMEELGYKRLLFWGGAGALTLPNDPSTRLWQTPKYPRQLVEHSKHHVMVLEAAKKTQLEWTMLCPPMVYSVPPTGALKTRKNVPTGGTAVSALDMADFVVDTLLDPAKGKEWIGQQVGLSSDGLSMNKPAKKEEKL